MAALLGIAAFIYTGLAAGCAIFLLTRAYALPKSATVDDFNKYAIAALVAVVGTGLSGIASVYSATRQAATASQVAEYNGDISYNLAAMKEAADNALVENKGKIDGLVAEVKAASDATLARLKVALDLGHVAYRELFGSATIYFHALRSISLGNIWDDAILAAAEAGMIAATPRVIHVDMEMRNEWFAFWQRAQTIRAEAATKAKALRADVIADLIEQRENKLDLRERHGKLESLARSAMEKALQT
jgi:hypothetical protein